jgi:hypothetical protein
MALSASAAAARGCGQVPWVMPDRQLRWSAWGGPMRGGCVVLGSGGSKHESRGSRVASRESRWLGMGAMCGEESTRRAEDWW